MQDPKRIQTLLVANRGEIACRVMATAKRMGIRTVAIYSEADANAIHVEAADDAVLVGSALASESYLNIEAIIAAAKQTGANAIHPGYGFLSENPEFVDACDAAGITFVGPTAKSMRSMGLKDAAKALMESAGVPVVPGYHGENQDVGFLSKEAERIGYPVLIKARAGGGGKGMRKVEQANDFAAALEGAQREGKASFGDSAVLIEKYIEQPRHIEVQVFGDKHGNTVHLFERDCSLQRRHQKVIEEAPAPSISEEVRNAMTSAAIRSAQLIDYVGAGTVEFIVDASGPLRSDGFWFMEMNTRLQVEHPVTEAVTGFDLVEWQLQVAAGLPIPVQQDDITLNGHAVEARLYAEDVGAGFLPATGTLHRFALSEHGRVDSGVREGDVVQPYYDPMLSKLISHAPSREQAFAQLHRSLDESVVLGAITNRAFLARLCQNPAVIAGDVHTGLIEQSFAEQHVAEQYVSEQNKEQSSSHANNLLPSSSFEYECSCTFAAIVCAQTGLQALQAQPSHSQGNEHASVFEELGVWQLWGASNREITLVTSMPDRDPLATQLNEQSVQFSVERLSSELWKVSLNPHYVADTSNENTVEQLPRLGGGGITLSAISAGDLTSGSVVTIGDHALFVACIASGDTLYTRVGELESHFSLPVVEMSGSAADANAQLLAPMPGRIIAVGVKAGDTVNQGDVMITLEAMKMEHTLVAGADVQVDSVLVSVGDQVEQGAQLVRFELE